MAFHTAESLPVHYTLPLAQKQSAARCGCVYKSVGKCSRWNSTRVILTSSGVGGLPVPGMPVCRGWFQTGHMHQVEDNERIASYRHTPS